MRKISPPTGIRSSDCPARSESLYRLSYPASIEQIAKKTKLKIALFWVITQRVMTIPYRRFGTTYRSHLQGSKYNDYDNNPEQRSSQLLRGRKLNSHKGKLVPLPVMSVYRENTVIGLPFLISALDGGEWSASRFGCFSTRKQSQDPTNGRQRGPHGRSGRLKVENCVVPMPEL
jgi:hypothetical protein